MKNNGLHGILGLCLLLLLAGPGEAQTDEDTPLTPQEWLSLPWVHLQTLDKITARISDLYVEVGTRERFQAISILVQACYAKPPQDTPESSVYLEITERNLKDEEATIFQGWMFASSPSAHALEHPVYDVWVRDCLVEVPESLVTGKAPKGSR